MIKVGDVVKLPFGDEGKVVNIKNIIWGCKFIVTVTKVNSPFRNIGDIEDFKEIDLVLVNRKNIRNVSF